MHSGESTLYVKKLRTVNLIKERRQAIIYTSVIQEGLQRWSLLPLVQSLLSLIHGHIPHVHRVAALPIGMSEVKKKRLQNTMPPSHLSQPTIASLS